MKTLQLEEENITTSEEEKNENIESKETSQVDVAMTQIEAVKLKMDDWMQMPVQFEISFDSVKETASTLKPKPDLTLYYLSMALFFGMSILIAGKRALSH